MSRQRLWPWNAPTIGVVGGTALRHCRCWLGFSPRSCTDSWRGSTRARHTSLGRDLFFFANLSWRADVSSACAYNCLFRNQMYCNVRVQLLHTAHKYRARTTLHHVSRHKTSR